MDKGEVQWDDAGRMTLGDWRWVVRPSKPEALKF
jgi:hypothetical protein